MLGNPQQYEKVYQILADTCVKYFPKAYGNAFYVDGMKKYLKDIANNTWKENHDFPAKYFSIAGTLMIHWFTDDFDGVSEAYQISMHLQDVGEIHLRYLRQPAMTKKLWENLLDETNELKGRPKPIQKLCVRMMEDINEHDRIRQEHDATGGKDEPATA